jgi:hypothetical protein
MPAVERRSPVLSEIFGRRVRPVPLIRVQDRKTLTFADVVTTHGIATINPEVVRFFREQEAREDLGRRLLQLYADRTCQPPKTWRMEDLVSSQCAALSFKISPRSMRRRAQKGWFQRIHIGRRAYYLKDEVIGVLQASLG